MQAVLTNNKTIFKTGELSYLFNELEGADNFLKNSIENKIVNFGDAAVDFLVDKLVASKGVQRGVAAMSLIRIGEGSIGALKRLAEINKNYAWVANYIIHEIQEEV